MPVNREAVIAEIAFLKSGAALEYQSVAKGINPADAGQDPGEDIILFENLPGKSCAFACFLKSYPEGPHSATFPGRFS